MSRERSTDVGEILPIDRISIIRLEDLLGGELRGWPRRLTDRGTQNAINASFGGENEHFLHGRTVVGTGEDCSEWFRGMIVPGQVIADVILQMQDAWLLELVKVEEKVTRGRGYTEVPKTKAQFKWCGPETDTSGEPDPWKTVAFLNALRSNNLSVRGFWLNHYLSGDFVSVVMSPAQEPGILVEWNFYREDSYVLLEF